MRPQPPQPPYPPISGSQANQPLSPGGSMPPPPPRAQVARIEPFFVLALRVFAWCALALGFVRMFMALYAVDRFSSSSDFLFGLMTAGYTFLRAAAIAALLYTVAWTANNVKAILERLPVREA